MIKNLQNDILNGISTTTCCSNAFLSAVISVTKDEIDENQMIFTSIPYDESWKITIDGNEIKPIKILDNLIGIECPKGNHKLKLEYKINYTIPLLISILTFICIIIHSISQKRKILLFSIFLF